MRIATPFTSNLKRDAFSANLVWRIFLSILF